MFQSLKRLGSLCSSSSSVLVLNKPLSPPSAGRNRRQLSSHLSQLARSNFTTMAPLFTKQEDALKRINELIKANGVMIFSKTTCPFCSKVTIKQNANVSVSL